MCVLKMRLLPLTVQNTQTDTQTDTHIDRQTDSSENITYPHTRMVISRKISNQLVWMQR